MLGNNFFNGKKKRILAVLSTCLILAGVVSPSFSAVASTHDNRDGDGGTPSVVPGTIIIDYVDADVIGAQADTQDKHSPSEYIRYEEYEGDKLSKTTKITRPQKLGPIVDEKIEPMLDSMKDANIPYWGVKNSTVKYRDFAYTPQGAGSFSKRSFLIFVFKPTSDVAKKFDDLQKAGDGDDGNVSYDQIIKLLNYDESNGGGFKKDEYIIISKDGENGCLTINQQTFTSAGFTASDYEGAIILVMEDHQYDHKTNDFIVRKKDKDENGNDVYKDAYKAVYQDTLYMPNVETKDDGKTKDDGEIKHHSWQAYFAYCMHSGQYVQWDDDMKSVLWLTGSDGNMTQDYIEPADENVPKSNAVTGHDKQSDEDRGFSGTSYNMVVRPSVSQTYPLGNVIERGGFTFKVRDNETDGIKSQGDAKLLGDGSDNEPEPTVFAIYNINTENTSSISTDGYVIADRNNDGEFNYNEEYQFIPAYSRDEVIKAWQSYLREGADYNTYSNKRLGDDCWPYNDDEFIIGNTMHGGVSVPIIPVMTVKPNSAGEVSINKDALPAGNYLVLQVSAGEGYYIDENFKTIVSIGRNQVSVVDNGKILYDDYFGEKNGAIASDMYSFNAVTKTTMTETVSTVDFGKSVSAGNFNVVLVPTGWNIDISEPKIVISGNKLYGFGVEITYKEDNKCELSFKNKDIVETNIRNVCYYENPKASYVQMKIDKPTGRKFAADKIRMVPNEKGYSRFTAYMTVIRSGGDILLADHDDVGSLALYDVRYMSGKNLKGTSYLAAPQGDGKFNGTTFTINLDGKTVWDPKTKSPITDQTRTYTVSEKGADVPEDLLPYGSYTFTQTGYGKGYGSYDDVTANKIEVRVEDEMDFDTIVPGNMEYRKNNNDAPEYPSYESAGARDGRSYFTNTLATGGELYSVTLSDGYPLSNDDYVTLSVYNISDSYVWTDAKEDGRTYYDTTDDIDLDGNKERYETMQALYNNNIKNKKISDVAQLSSLLKASNNAKVREIRVPINTMNNGVVADLPYGRYLIAVSNVPDGYEVKSDIFGTDDIDGDGDYIEFELELSIAPPGLDTTAKDSNTGTHTAAASSRTSISDTVTYTGLEAKTKYLLRTMVADKKTGEVIEQIPVVETEFETSELGNGRITVPVPVNTSAYKGRSIVIFEELYDSSGLNLLMSHRDIEDMDQTIVIPDLSTVLTGSDGSSKTVTAGTETVVQDTLKYSGLEPGVTYKIKSSVVNKVGGKEIGEPVETEFTPDSEEGSITVSMTVNTLELNGQKIVAFENIIDSYSDTVVVKHEDVNDANQTVTVSGFAPGEGEDSLRNKNGSPQTGVDQYYAIFIVLGLLGLTVVAYFVNKYRKSRITK